MEAEVGILPYLGALAFLKRGTPCEKRVWLVHPQKCQKIVATKILLNKSPCVWGET